MMRKYQVRFGGGRLEKKSVIPMTDQLAGRLPYAYNASPRGGAPLQWRPTTAVCNPIQDAGARWVVGDVRDRHPGWGWVAACVGGRWFCYTT